MDGWKTIVSFWDGFLAGAMLVSGSVSYIDRVKIDWHSSQGIFFVIEANVLSLTFWGLAVYRLPNIKAMDFFPPYPGLLAASARFVGAEASTHGAVENDT